MAMKNKNLILDKYHSMMVDLVYGRVGAKHLRYELLMENNVRSQMLCPYD
jgi:hypothetical protein